jgi:enoyl-CoA hydratase
LVNEVVANGRHVERSLELAELLASFPQETLRADRQAIRQSLDRALLDSFAGDAEVARATADVATRGANEFSARAKRKEPLTVAAPGESMTQLPPIS